MGPEVWLLEVCEVPKTPARSRGRGSGLPVWSTGDSARAADRTWGSGVQLVFRVTVGRPGGFRHDTTGRQSLRVAGRHKWRCQLWHLLQRWRGGLLRGLGPDSLRPHRPYSGGQRATVKHRGQAVTPARKAGPVPRTPGSSSRWAPHWVLQQSSLVYSPN